MRAWTKLRGDTRGQALVEFALVLPLLILLLMAIFEFGNIFHSYLVITNASRDGVRMGVVGKTDAQIEARVKELCSSLDTSPSKFAIDIVPGEDLGPRVPGTPLTVSVHYKVDLFTPLLSTFLPNPVELSARAQMRVE